MDMAVISPQVRLALDTLIVKICNDQWKSVNDVRKGISTLFDNSDAEIKRVADWAEDLTNGEKPLQKELLVARRDIEESAELIARPSRELDDYAIHTVPYLGSGPSHQIKGTSLASSKQGWLFLRTVTGKPARTHWTRRWFFVKNGIFGCLVHGARTGGVEESEKIGVLLCGVRPAFQEERRFCFEVKTKDNTILVQAETQFELTEWVHAFEAAKKKAIEDSDKTNIIASSSNPSSDAAFAVSPAVAPELASKGADGQITSITEDPQASLLPPEPDGTPNMQARSSFDIGAMKRQEGEREGERTRDHAARILEKLDIHKKSTAGSQLTGGIQSPNSGGSGVSSLIAPLSIGPSLSPTPGTSPSKFQYSSSLVPYTLANPPVQTNLTKTALKLGIDRGLDLGAVDSTGGVPSSLMANQWGSANYGYISRLERGEVDKKPISQPPSPGRRASDPTDAIDDAQPPTSLPNLQHVASTTGLQTQYPLPRQHRKTLSVESTQASRPIAAIAEYPGFYPGFLRAHDAQFRVLFPNVPHHERIVLVFRAAWNPDMGHSLPGRVFVTQREIFFYSHHMGMVLVHGVSLDNIADVSHELGSIHNYLYLHMKEDVPPGHDEGIMLKIFLDSPELLEQRLNYLIQSNDAEEPDDLETSLHKLTRIEANVMEVQRQQSSQYPGPGQRLTRRMTSARGTRVRVDRSITIGTEGPAGMDGGETARFKLPSQPVNYTPLDITAHAAEKKYDVSAKALLHAIFGDKSAVCPTIYQQRGSEAITQHPWVKQDDQGRFKRRFDYQIQFSDVFGRPQKVSVIDIQSIDVTSDHLCYMVTETKVPWHLPRPKDFTLVTKVVVTHEAKSKSKLSIFTKVDWLRNPWVGKSMIERRAVDDMELDALNMMDIVTEQVQRLGAGCSTRRVIEIFGGIGQQTEAAQVKGPPNVGRPLRMAVHKRTILSLGLENARSLAASAVSTIIMLIFGTLKVVGKTVSAHAVLAFLLLLTMSHSFYSLTSEAKIWWHDRHTARFMSKLGVVPNLSMSRSLYLRDVADAVSTPAFEIGQASNQCFQTFGGILNATSLDDTTAMFASDPQRRTSLQSTSSRLRRTRQRLGTYRHDIIVALRLINRIERDTVRAEYENWLITENKMCYQVHQLVDKTINEPATNRTIFMGNKTSSTVTSSNERLQQMSTWLKGYCESCRHERESIEGIYDG